LKGDVLSKVIALAYIYQEIGRKIIRKKTMHPMLILIAGLPGSGKTYFAKAFAQKLDAKHLSSDVLRQQLDLKGQYDEGIKKRVYEDMQELTQQYITQGATVVVDATFYKEAVRDLYIGTAEKNKVPYFIIQIKAEEETIQKRLQKKREYSEADFEVYQKIKKSFEPIRQHHLVLWSDKMEMEEMVEKGMAYINFI
jgi:predicted kinase